MVPLPVGAFGRRETRLPSVETGMRPIVSWADDSLTWLGAGANAEGFAALLISLDLLRKGERAGYVSAQLLSARGDRLALRDGREPAVPAVRAMRRNYASSKDLLPAEVFGSVTGNIQASFGIQWSADEAIRSAKSGGTTSSVDLGVAVAFRRFVLMGLAEREGVSLNDLPAADGQTWIRLGSLARFVAEHFDPSGGHYPDWAIDAEAKRRAKRDGVPFRLLKVCPDGCGVIFAGRADKARCDTCKASSGGRATNPPDDPSVVDWSARRVKGEWEYREVRFCRCGDDFVSHRTSGAGAQKLLCGPCSRNRASYSRANRGT